MQNKKMDRIQYSFYFTRIQRSMIEDWIDYLEVTEGHQYKSDHIFKTIFSAMKNDEGFNKYIENLRRESK